MTAKRPYLQALGIPLWLPRQTLALQPPALDADGAGQDAGMAESWPPEQLESEHLMNPSLPPDDRELEGDWEPVSEFDEADFSSPPPLLSREARIAAMDWEALTAEAQQCRACGLCAARTQVVFGVGNRQADWLVIGEGPGADEDQQGEPFVGRAGKLLNPMLLAIGVQRDQAYITNIVRCRPPENREPTPEEAAQCRPFLERQIALIRPRIILAVGRIAAQNLLNTDTQIGKLRGQTHRFGPTRIPLVVTYHPAYLLRSPREKRKAWDDLRLARRVLAAEAADTGSATAKAFIAS